LVLPAGNVEDTFCEEQSGRFYL